LSELGVDCRQQGRIHRSLLVSISPNNSLLPPLLELATEVADAADEMVEKDVEGFVASAAQELSCLKLILERQIS
jgi:hypothetical protein